MRRVVAVAILSDLLVCTDGDNPIASDRERLRDREISRQP
jgi:hypothetical protein